MRNAGERAPGSGDDGARSGDGLGDAVERVTGRLRHLVRLAEATSDPGTTAEYLLAATEALASETENLRAALSAVRRSNFN